MSAMVTRLMDVLDDEDTLIVWDSDVVESADDPEDYAYGVVWLPA